MKFNKIILLLLTAIMASCTIINLEDPLKGKITLVTDWSKRVANSVQPSSYTVVIAGQTINCTQASNCLPELNAGTYPIYIYNSCDEITINGTTAMVNTTNSTVDPFPGWLFTSVNEVVYADFKEETITTVMQQQVRPLTIELTITEGDPEHIASTTAILTGIANNLDFKTNIYSGTNLSVTPVFIRNGNKLTATIRLLGITNEVQKLTLGITFTNGRTQYIESDISTLLTEFNTSKHIPLNISADLNTPIETEFIATITGWKVKESSSGVAW